MIWTDEDLDRLAEKLNSSPNWEERIKNAMEFRLTSGLVSNNKRRLLNIERELNDIQTTKLPIYLPMRTIERKELVTEVRAIILEELPKVLDLYFAQEE